MYIKKYLTKVKRQSQYGGWSSNQKLSTVNIIQELGSVLEGIKNCNIFKQIHQIVQEIALELP